MVDTCDKYGPKVALNIYQNSTNKLFLFIIINVLFVHVLLFSCHIVLEQSRKVQVCLKCTGMGSGTRRVTREKDDSRVVFCLNFISLFDHVGRIAGVG